MVVDSLRMGVRKRSVDDENRDERVGLCRTCKHVRVINSARGSTFYLCQLSETDSRFVKYPALPVVRCAGYEETREEETT